jgi:hypothetical protein
MPNTGNAGIVRLAVVSTRGINGSGPVVTINFDRPGKSNGKIISMTAKVINTTGGTLAMQTQVVNPAETDTALTADTTATTEPPTTPAETATTGQTSGSSTESATTATSPGTRHLGAGTVTIPSEMDDTAKLSENRETASGESAEAMEDKAAGAGTETMAEDKSAELVAKAVAPEQKNIVYKSVLERFREFDGQKTPQALTALFDPAATPGVRQEPAVALSDGKTKVKVFIQLPHATKDATNFALRGAKLVSLKKEGTTWVVEALPENKVYEASITALSNGATTEIPLTLAPPVGANIGAAGKLDEAGFALFLKEKGTDKKPGFDLNGDKVRNYIDDYIYTANYVAKHNSAKKAK